MEKDRKIEQLIKESGTVPAPGDFTGHVMDRIKSEPVKRVYKPLIGKWGGIFILAVILGFIIISVFYSEPSDFLAEHNLALSEWNLEFLNIPDINFSAGFIAVVFAALVVVFVMALADLKSGKKLI